MHFIGGGKIGGLQLWQDWWPAAGTRQHVSIVSRHVARPLFSLRVGWETGMVHIRIIEFSHRILSAEW